MKRRAKKIPSWLERFPILYRGYWIKANLSGDLWVEKDGYLIAWSTSEEQAKQTIDNLLGGPLKNAPSRRKAEIMLREGTAHGRKLTPAQRRLFGMIAHNPPRLVEIYGKLLRIEAKKGRDHRCDPECARADHSYYHDFNAGAVIYGLPDGSLYIHNRNGKRLWNWF